MYRADSGYVEKAKSTISNAASSLNKKSYAVPNIPNTPSRTINEMLHARCDKSYENPVQAGIAHYICLVFTAITRLYEMLHKETRPSHTMWMAACGIVSAAIILKIIIAYQILIASAFLVHFVLYYAAIGMALFGTGLGVAGAVFFDKGGSKASTGFGETVTTQVRSTYSAAKSSVETGAQQYTQQFKDD